MKVWETIRFGEYDWRVLDVQDGRALLLSDKAIIENKPYHPEWGEMRWENCALRTWLNGEFYESFGGAKSRIAETQVETPDNPWFGSKGGDPTSDRIFLLSIEEVVRYFGDSGQLVSKRPEPEIEVWDDDLYDPDGEYSDDDSDNVYIIDDQYNDARMAGGAKSGLRVWWWLRTPGFKNLCAAGVGGTGHIDLAGLDVFDGFGCVRPALWLVLE